MKSILEDSSVKLCFGRYKGPVERYMDVMLSVASLDTVFQCCLIQSVLALIATKSRKIEIPECNSTIEK